MTRKNILTLTVVALLVAAALIATAVLQTRGTARTERASATSSSRLEAVTYSTTYEGRAYEKTAYVYVPDSSSASEPMNVFYLMHGSSMDNASFAQRMQTLFDAWRADGSMPDQIVVFPTYYPDRSFVQSNYTADYPLNHFFAETEVNQAIQAVESRFMTFARQNTSEESLRSSRTHRAFGGYSMGGITTWDVLVEHPEYFADYMPMAGDSWIQRGTSSSADATADMLVSGLRANGYGTQDVTVVAMVGENDGTKYSMIPQIDALRAQHADIFTDTNLIYWENAGGGHSQESLEAEVQHGLQYLFRRG